MGLPNREKMSMCRISPIDPSTAIGLAQQVLDAVKTKFGMVPMMARTMAQSGAVLAGWQALSDALAEGALGPRTGTLIALAIAQANSSQYCLATHTAIAGALGLTPNQQLEARRGRAADRKEAAAVRLALAILEMRGGVSDDELAIARTAGLSDPEVSEVSAHVALNVFTNYFNRLADTEIDFPRVDARLPGNTV
jgi:AhpD family alkylhydroperoxidase